MDNNLPPPAFINKINDLIPNFDFTDWRNSREWKIFMAGQNYALDRVEDHLNTIKWPWSK